MQHHYQERCNFVVKTSECQDEVELINYLSFIFCDIGSHGQYLYIGGVVLVAILCLYFFSILATTSDKL